MTINRYDSQRWGATMTHLLTLNKKGILWGTLGIAAASMLIGFFQGMERMVGTNSGCDIYYTVYALISIIYASMAFADLKDKDSLGAALMLPASAFDKLSTRWLVYVPGFMAVMFLSYYLGETTRIITIEVLSRTIGFKLETNYVNFWEGVQSAYRMMGAAACFMLVSGFVLYQALFFLGSLVFRKLAALKTFAILWGISLVLGFMPKGMMRAIMDLFVHHAEAFMWTTGGICLTIAAAAYAISYILMKRIQSSGRF